jgi:hypothetical protein
VSWKYKSFSKQDASFDLGRWVALLIALRCLSVTGRLRASPRPLIRRMWTEKTGPEITSKFYLGALISN